MHLRDSWPMNGRIRSTLHAWAWPFILAAFAEKDDGTLADEDISDRYLFDISQIDPRVTTDADEDKLDRCGIADCYADVGLLRRVNGGFVLAKR